MQIIPSLIKSNGRRVVCAAPVLFVGLLAGCAFFRLPLPVVPFTINVLEDQEIPGFPRVIDSNIEGRPGVIGLMIPLPQLCDLAPLELVVRAYEESIEVQELGELSNNIFLKEARIREMRLTTDKGKLDFIAEAGLRLIGKDKTITYWSDFTDRDNRTELVFTPNEPFDVFDIVPGEDECIAIDLLYSGSYPEKDIRVSLSVTIEIEADWQF